VDGVRCALLAGLGKVHLMHGTSLAVGFVPVALNIFSVVHLLFGRCSYPSSNMLLFHPELPKRSPYGVCARRHSMLGHGLTLQPSIQSGSEQP
jgi:hypothetical protein